MPVLKKDRMNNKAFIGCGDCRIVRMVPV
jgi:hypothetical protein